MLDEKNNVQENKNTDSLVVILPEDITPNTAMQTEEVGDVSVGHESGNEAQSVTTLPDTRVQNSQVERPRSESSQTLARSVDGQFPPEEILRIPPSHLQIGDKDETVIIMADEISSSLPEIIQISPVIHSQPPVEVQPLAEDQTQIILPHEIALPQPEFLISPEDLVKPTLVREPPDGSQVGSRPLEVVGEAEPYSRLVLEVGDFQSETFVPPNGRFTFKDIRLHPGWNEIQVSSLTFPGFVRSRAAIQIYRSERNLLFIGLKDIYTQSIMTEEDDVIRCRKCGTFARMDSWRATPGCASWMCGGQHHWSPDDPQFHEEEPALEKR